MAAVPAFSNLFPAFPQGALPASQSSINRHHFLTAMSYRIIVLVKQVPDTKNVTGEAMKADGTINRAALPTVFNPEDLNALEMALEVKDRYGAHVTALTMGPPSAAEVLREALYRGADEVALVTDRKFAGADTLATAYALCCAIRRVGKYDFVIAGRQAIDGDTAQIGPQVAGKLDIPQVTYAEQLIDLAKDKAKLRRSIEGGYEIVEARLPVLLTVGDTANEPRPACVKRLMQYKKAKAGAEVMSAMKGAGDPDAADKEIQRLEERELLIPEWDVECISADPSDCGLSGSPTRVYKIESVVLTSGEYKSIEPTPEAIRELIHELVADHTLE